MRLRPERPSDSDYYERDRVELFSQGELFRDAPLAYPLPADELVIDEDERGGSRRFLKQAPRVRACDIHHAALLAGRAGGGGYAHPVRTLVPVLPLTELAERGVV